LKLTVSRETFLARLGVAVRAASTRSAIQTLAGVLIRVEEDRAELQATDMELGLRVALEPASSTPGQAVIPGRLLLDVARSLPKDEITLEYRSAQQDVEVTSGQARFHLRTLPQEDFPKLPEPPTEGVLTVPTEAFVETIARVARAASRDETRPHLTGVLVTASGRELRMVATDSYRLGVRETKLDEELDGTLEANVPARTLQELGRIAGASGADTIGVAALENQVIFTTAGVVLSSRLVEGRFPNYQQLLPESYEHELRVSREELLEVVRRVGLLAQKNAPLRLRFTEGALDVSAQTPDVGEASESLPVPFAGEELEIGFNPEFFREGIESAESDELTLKLISPLRPGLIESGDDGAGFRYLVMPIRLNV
jgi:DNA polymerase III subunit beta